MHPRAQWAALRTFHRRVKKAGRTATGQRTFALGSVQLTYPPGAGHFYRLAPCARCGEIIELPEPVLIPADLELIGQPHLCPACSRDGIDNLASRAVRPRRPASPPAAVPLQTEATDLSTIVGPAMSRAEEILADARRMAADLVAEAQREASELRATAAGETADQSQAHARALLADAEVRAAEIRAAAEAELEAAISLVATPPLPAAAEGQDAPPPPAAEDAGAEPRPDRSSPGDDGTGDGNEA